MLGDSELAAIAVVLALWVAALAAFALRRKRAAAWLLAVAIAGTLATLALLRAGTGHRG